MHRGLAGGGAETMRSSGLPSDFLRFRSRSRSGVDLSLYWITFRQAENVGTQFLSLRHAPVRCTTLDYDRLREGRKPNGISASTVTGGYGVEMRPLLVATSQRLPQRTMDSTLPTPGTVPPGVTLQIPFGPSKTAVPLVTSRSVQPAMVVGLVSGHGVSFARGCRGEDDVFGLTSCPTACGVATLRATCSCLAAGCPWVTTGCSCAAGSCSCLVGS